MTENLTDFRIKQIYFAHHNQKHPGRNSTEIITLIFLKLCKPRPTRLLEYIQRKNKNQNLHEDISIESQLNPKQPQHVPAPPVTAGSSCAPPSEDAHLSTWYAY